MLSPIRYRSLISDIEIKAARAGNSFRQGGATFLHVINEGKLLKKNLMIFADHPCKLRLEPNLKWAVMGLELLISEVAWKVETGYAKSMTNLYRNTKTIYHLAVRSTVYSDVLANIKICLSGANKEVASFKIS